MYSKINAAGQANFAAVLEVYRTVRTKVVWQLGKFTRACVRDRSDSVLGPNIFNSPKNPSILGFAAAPHHFVNDSQICVGCLYFRKIQFTESIFAT